MSESRKDCTSDTSPTAARAPNSVRKQAKEFAKKLCADLAQAAADDLQQVIYELKVHQIELEIQNEELRGAQVALLQARDRYAGLFEFAPVGYVTMARDGGILESNLMTAVLLGVDRSDLMGASLTKFIARESQDAFSRHRQSVFSSAGKQSCELRMERKDGDRLTVKLESAAVESDEFTYCRTTLVNVTAQRQAEGRLKSLNQLLHEQVKERTHEFQLLAEAVSRLGEGVVITDDELDWPGPRIVFVNEAMCRISGYSADELIGQSPRILQGNGTSRETLDRMRRELNGGRSCLVELTNYRKQGSPYDAELFITPLLNAEGQRTNYVSIHRDITDRKQAELRLQQSEGQKGAILAALMAHIAVLDLQGKIVAVNPAWEAFAENGGVASKCNVGANYIDVCRDAHGLCAEDAVKVADGLRAVLGKEIDHFTMEYACHSPCEERWFLLHATPLDDRSRGAVVSNTNITDRVHAELERESEHEVNRSIISTAQIIVLVLDADGRIATFNPYMEQLCGWKLDEVRGKDWFTTFLPECDASRIRGLFQQSLGGAPTRGNVNTIVTKLGKEREIEWYDAPLRGFDGQLIGLLCTGQDITARRQLERHVLEIASLEQQRIGQDLHDGVGQELTGLGMMADALAVSLKRKSVPECQIAAKLAAGLKNAVAEIRLLSRGLNPVEVDVNGLHSALQELVDRASQLYGIPCTLHWRTELLLPDGEKATQLYRIAQEAINNAAKHAKPSRIDISLEAFDGTAELKVVDDGIGIGVEDSQGLGLRSMAYRAGVIGGNLKIESAPSGGTMVTCTLVESRPDAREFDRPTT